ncbi:MAG: hypothetical protein ABH846_00500 [Patescibacteria group bacterium]
MSQLATVLQTASTWSIWDLDDDERESVLFLRRLMRQRQATWITSIVINEEIDKIRAELEAQRRLYREWFLRPWRWFSPAPFNPDDYILPLVATSDGWVDFMLALERLRLRGVLIEEEMMFTGFGLMYSLRD